MDSRISRLARHLSKCRALKSRAHEIGCLDFSVSLSRIKRQIGVANQRAVIASQRSETPELSSDRRVRRWAVGLTSLSFIVLQSACTLAMTLSGVRLAIGLGALAAVAVGSF